MSENANKPAKKEPKPAKKAQEFEVVYYLSSDSIQDPEKIQTLFMPKKYSDEDGQVQVDPEEGSIVRLFPGSKVERSGYVQGKWGQNIQRLRMDLAIWAMEANSTKAAELRKEADDFETAETTWAEFISTL